MSSLSYSAGAAYTEASVLTAPPGRLVVMLYDGAVRFIAQSATAMRAGERERARDRMRRGEAIIDELNLSLDMSHGKIPESLRSIYLFCKRELREAGVDGDADRVERVVKILRDLRDAWEQVSLRAEQPAV
jgi:flagellar secretion chaperone FliS